MAKGFKKKIGNKIKFVPTNGSTKSSISSKDIRSKKRVEKSSGDDLKQRKMHTTKDIWTYDEAPQELKDKIIEKLREDEYEYSDDFFAEYDGIIYDKKSDIGDYDVFKNYNKKYYDLDRGQYIQFPDLEIKDEAKLYKMLELPKSLMDKVDIRFNSERESNTRIEFWEDEGQTTLRLGDFPYSEYKEASEKYDEKPMSEKEFNALENATEKWDDMMHNAWSSLRDNYEYQFTDEALIEKARSNEYDFDEDGNIA